MEGGYQNKLEPYGIYIENSLDCAGLCRRINSARRSCGLRRAQSKLCLKGETRTFAEILDGEVEKVVLFYIKQQGSIAEKTWELRSLQVTCLQDFNISSQKIEDLCQRYRQLGNEVLDLLGFLDSNVKSLRRIIQNHDACFDLKLAAVYFDSKFGRNSRNAQLLPLYHQDGIRAIMTTIRRGFEELHEAKNALQGNREGLYLSSSNAAMGKSKVIPRISFGNRLASVGNLGSLLSTTTELTPHASTPKYKHKSTGSLFNLMHKDSPSADSSQQALERSISDLEPILQQIDSVAERVMHTQRQSVAEILTATSEMALEVSMDDIPGVPGKEDEDAAAAMDSARFSSHTMGLYLNLFMSFVYLANQYVVAPTSGQYAKLLGMTPAMGGIIIGLCPAAALVSSLFYSMWSNVSFKQPILMCIACEILGNLSYAMALQYNSPFLILLGRLLTGFGGPRVITRRYIADHVPQDRRLLASSQFVTVSAMGLACGPLISSLVARSGVSFQWNVHSIWGGEGDMAILWYQTETAPGWIMAVLWLLALVVTIVYFHEPEQQYMRATKLKKVAESRNDLLASSGTLGPPSHRRQLSNSSTSSSLHGQPLSMVVMAAEPGLDKYDWTDNQQQLKQQGSSKNTFRTPSPINLNPSNNNVFNLTSDKMEHAIPDEHTGLLGSSSTHSYHSSGSLSPTRNHAHLSIEDGGIASSRRDTGSYMIAAQSKTVSDVGAVDDDISIKEPPFWEYLSMEVLAILLIYTVNKTGQELVISSIPVITLQEFDWTAEGGGYYMAIVGASVLPMILAMSYFMQDSEEREMVLQLTYTCIIFLCMLLHFTIFGDYTILQYVIGSAMLFACLNTLEGVIMTLLSKLLSPELAKGTFNSGLLATEAGTFGRVIGDFCITFFGASHNPTILVNTLFLPLVLMMLLTLGLIHYYYDRLI